MIERIWILSVTDGLPLFHSYCLLFNNHLKLSKLAVPVVIQLLILNSVMETSKYLT